MRSPLRATLAATALVTAALLSGCGGDDGGDAGDDSSESTSEDGGSDGDFTDLSAEEISDTAKDAMETLEGVTIAGTLSTGGGEIELDMAIGQDGNCTGSFTTQGATAEVLGVEGTTWFRPDEAYWQQFAGPEAAPGIIEAVGTRWVTLPDDDTAFKPFCDIEQFIGQLVDSGEETEATYTKGEVEEIDGEETIEIISDRPEDGTSSGYVLVDGDHYVVRIAKTEGADPGEISFSGFNEQPDVTEPGADEQVSLAELEAAGY